MSYTYNIGSNEKRVAMSNYEIGYESGFTGKLHQHHEGLIFDSDYAEGFEDGKSDRVMTVERVPR